MPVGDVEGERLELYMAAKAKCARLKAIQGDGGCDGRLAVQGDWWLKGRPVGRESEEILIFTGKAGPRLVDPYGRSVVVFREGLG